MGGGAGKRTKEKNVWIDQCQQGRPWHQGATEQGQFSFPVLGTHSHTAAWPKETPDVAAPAIYPQMMSEERQEGEED